MTRREANRLLVGLALWAMPLGARAVAAPALQWESERVTLAPPAGAADAMAEFKFTNRSETVVRVLEARSSCGCTVAALDKDMFQPGESGNIRARFHIGEREGRQSVTVWVTTDESGAKPYELALAVEIQTPVRLVPRMLWWKIGEEPVPKLVQVRLLEAWRVESVAVNSEDFAVELLKGDDGAIQLRVTPRDTWASRNSLIKLKVAHGDEPPVEFVAWVRVL